MNKYENYSINDFVFDEEFVAWCKNMPGANHGFWQKVIEAYPEQAKNMDAARDFILHATVTDQLPSVVQIRNMWKGIEHELNAPKQSANVRRLSRISWLKAAAVLLLVAGGSLLAYFIYTPGAAVIQTQYAEILELELPDHSKITLNSNSVIRYNKTWDSGKPREVWLTGEAYFEISHLHTGKMPVKPGERFIVHANGVDIEVLGTSFNINNRHEAARITLTSGSIELKFADKKLNNILMKPGEEVSYSKASRKIEKQKAESQAADAWKEHRLEFDGTTLKEVLQLLEDNYGLKAEVEDPELWNKTISGMISSENTEIVLQGISVLLDVEIEQKGKSLILKK